MKTSLLAACFGLAVQFSGNSMASAGKSGVSADYPSASPSGTAIVLSADFDGPTRIWVAGLDGSALRKISKTYDSLTNVYETEPSWSPDGRRIVYTTISDGVSDIWVMQADGTYPTKLTANGANNTRPTWAPDSGKIAFVSDKMGTKDIWTMNADGTGQTRIIALAGEENRPSYSPKGDRIVFSETANESASLMVANADGSNVKTLTSGNYHDWDPFWGAVGIVFSSNRDPSSGNFKVWMVQPDGSRLQRVGNAIGQGPSFLHDGRILFTDETMTARAASSVALLNPATGSKQIAVNVQGYFLPIDIRPGKAINNINPVSRGKLEVAILSTKTFDATKAINQSSLTFGRSGSEQSFSTCIKSAKDVNNDGLPDLRCRFWTRSTGIQGNDKYAILRFADNNGTFYEGRDLIAIVVTEDADDFKNED